MADEDTIQTDADTNDPEDWAAASEEAIRGMKQATEAAKATQRALLLTQAHQAADALPSTLPTQGPPQQAPGAPAYDFGRGIGVLQPPAQFQSSTGTTPPPGPIQPPGAAPIQPPRNRMYMGANVGAPDATPQQFFDARGQAPNTAVNQMPPPTPDQASGAPSRVAAATSGVMNPGLSSTDDGARKFSVMQMIQQKQAMGQPVPPEQIAALLGGSVPKQPPAITPYQQAEIEHRKARLALDQQRLNQGGKPKPLTPPRETIKYPAVKPQEAVDGIPATRGFLGTGWGAKPAIPGQPAVPGQPSRTITRTLPMDEEGAPAVVPPPGRPAPAAASPFKEGQTVRNKKTGKLYKIVDGEPVLVDEGK